MDEKVKEKNADTTEKPEEELEEGLEETFPASDAAASTQPGDGGPDDKDKKK